MERAAQLQERACDLHLAGIYRKLGIGDLLERPRIAAQVAQELGFVESADIALEAMLWRLGKRTPFVAVETEVQPAQFRGVAAPPDPSQELTALRAELESLGDEYAASLEFLDFGATHFVEALQDDPGLFDRLLSGREPAFADVWDRATNLDPLQDVHGKMGARAVAQLFQGDIILEIGGGTGNGTRHLFRLLTDAEELDRIGRYVFTDISMPFILKTRREISAEFPLVQTEWRFLDINNSFEKQKVFPESVDLIYGVNAAHVAKDIVGFLRECYIALRSGGQVVFAERVRLDPRMMAPRELTLNLSVYHRTAALLSPEYRPTHSYLAPNNWIQALELGGFHEQEIWPNTDLLANSPVGYAAVVIGRKA